MNLLSLYGYTETETTVTKTTSKYCFLKVFLNEKIEVTRFLTISQETYQPGGRGAGGEE